MSRRKIGIEEDDLRMMYYVFGMTQQDIAGSYECHVGTIQYYMEKYGMQPRTVSEAHYLINARIEINLNQIDEIFDGNMLGDAWIKSERPLTAYFSQNCAPKFLPFLEDIKEKFNIAGLKSKIDSVTSNGYSGFRLRTIHHQNLKPQRSRWYPDGIKRVPDDVIISPISVAYWYMCDGCYNRRDKATSFATHAFSFDDVEYLCEQIKYKFDVLCWLQKAEKAKDGRQQYRIYIPVHSFPTFVELIEPYVLPVFRYKLGE